MVRAMLLALALLATSEGAFVHAATPTFFARRDYPDSAQWIQVGDANGDGIPDVVATSAGYITVLLGNGNGTFQALPRQTSGMEYSIVSAAGDLTGNGILDLVLSGPFNGSSVPSGIGLLFGNGDGTFQSPVLYQAGTDTDIGVVVLGDFNGDGILDAATPGESGLWLFTGTGNGTFNSPTLTPFNGESGSSGWIAAADFNGDGNLDLAVTTSTGFAILLGNGDGTFQTPQYYDAPTITNLAVGDLNMDGYPDIALVAQSHEDEVFLYLNNGSGGFSGPTFADLPPGYAGITIGDVNGDGINDLVNGYGYIALGKGNGKFDPPVHYPTDSSPFGAHNPVLADLRNNGLTDIVVQGSLAVSVLLAEGKGKFEDAIWTPVAGAYACGAPANFNGGASPDLALLTAEGITILLGTGDGNAPFSTGSSIPLTGAGCPQAADLTGNGIQDLLVPQQSTIFSYLGAGNGTFTLKVSAVFPSTVAGWAIGDFNHDGYPDIATDSFLIAYGNGDGTFQTPVSFWRHPPSCDFLPGIAAGDFNNDGWSDLAITCYETNSIYILLNKRHGGFTESSISNGDAPWDVILAPLTGNGDLDMLVSSYDLPAIYVYSGNGKGEFTLTQEIPFFNGPSDYAVADVNGDGKPDLLQLNPDSVAVILGEGNGKFADAPVFYWGRDRLPAR